MRRRGGPQRFSEEFRREAVRRARETDQPLKTLSSDIGVSVTTLRLWVRALPAQAPTAAARALSLEEQVRQLKRENDRLREERDILKKATAFFATDRR